MMKMMINCEQATYLIDKESYTPLKGKEKMDLKIHLMTCKYCSLYKVESKIINHKLTKIFKYNNVELHLSEEQKKKMIEKLNLDSNK